MKKSRIHKTSDSFNNLDLKFSCLMQDNNDYFPFVMDSP